MTALAALIPAGVRANVPVNPDAPTAQRWLVEELSNPAYQAAKPTWFDLASKAFWDWVTSLVVPDGGAWPGLAAVIGTVVVVALIVAAFLIFGAPRLNRRSLLAGTLFGDDDRRSADAMRRAAAAAAQSGDWSTAIEEVYRAIARSLAERTVITVRPGTTAREVAVQASRTFPEHAGRLQDAAAGFEAVRYFGEPGTEPGYTGLVGLDRALAAATPTRLPEASEPVLR